MQRGDGSAKGDWDVGITLDIIEHAPKLDRVVLLSGDGDFDLLLDKVRAVYGAQVEVYGVAALTAKALIDAADVFHPIDQSMLV